MKVTSLLKNNNRQDVKCNGIEPNKTHCDNIIKIKNNLGLNVEVFNTVIYDKKCYMYYKHRSSDNTCNGYANLNID